MEVSTWFHFRLSYMKASCSSESFLSDAGTSRCFLQILAEVRDHGEEKMCVVDGGRKVDGWRWADLGWIDHLKYA